MNCPTHILTPSTKIVTHAKLDTPRGMVASAKYLTTRKESAPATIGHPVMGHGGDVYFATHEDGTEAVYCYTEFELA